MTSHRIWYGEGTIDLEGGSAVVEGSADLAWTNQAHQGDALLVRSGPNAGWIAMIAEDAAVDRVMTLDRPWPYVTQAGLEYAIIPVSVKRSLATDAHARISALAGKLLHPYKVTGQPSDELGADGSFAIDPAAKQFWTKSAGSWGAPVSMIGEVSPAQLTAAIAGLNGGASAAYDTLKKIEDKVAPLLNGANAAYDTFAELYAYIQSDQTAGAAVNQALANRVRADAAQVFTAPQQAQARANIAAAGLSDIHASNLLINGDFMLNQRGFAGGALAAGAYGFDRWKADLASNLSVAGDVITLTSGRIAQVIEAAAWGVGSFAGRTVTVSVEAPTAPITVTVSGGATGTIPQGAGRQSVTLASAGTLNCTVTLASAGGGAVSFSRAKVELGAVVTPWEWRPGIVEELLAYRYFWKSFDRATAPANGVVTRRVLGSGVAAGTVDSQFLEYPCEMRVVPTITFLTSTESDFANNPNKWAALIGGSWVYGTTSALSFLARAKGCVVRCTAAGSVANTLYWLSGQMTADAEM